MKCLVLRGLRLSLMALLVVAAGSVLADPPPVTKPHGSRKKADPTYVGYTGHEWHRDYGVLEGKCNRKEIGKALNAVAASGAAASQVADASSRTVAVIVGSVLGTAIGREIGRKFDDRDRACFGHVLELTPEGQSVRWMNEKTSVTYVLEPHGKAESGGTCRTYKLTASKEDKSQSNDGRACRSEDGTWKKV